MLDCVRKELSIIGDKIVAAGGKNAELLLSEVTGFTAQKIRMKCVLASQQEKMNPVEFLKYPW